MTYVKTHLLLSVTCHLNRPHEVRPQCVVYNMQSVARGRDAERLPHLEVGMQVSVRPSSDSASRTRPQVKRSMGGGRAGLFRGAATFDGLDKSAKFRAARRWRVARHEMREERANGCGELPSIRCLYFVVLATVDPTWRQRVELRALHVHSPCLRDRYNVVERAVNQLHWCTIFCQPRDIVEGT